MLSWFTSLPFEVIRIKSRCTSRNNIPRSALNGELKPKPIPHSWLPNKTTCRYWKNEGFGVWYPVSTSVPTCSPVLTLGKICELSKPQFPLSRGNNNAHLNVVRVSKSSSSNSLAYSLLVNWRVCFLFIVFVFAFATLLVNESRPYCLLRKWEGALAQSSVWKTPIPHSSWTLLSRLGLECLQQVLQQRHGRRCSRAAVSHLALV